MHIHLIAVGTRMPDWVKAGFNDYAVRLPQECLLRLIEIPAGKRSKNAGAAQALREEGERMLAAIPAGSRVIALDVKGRHWDTDQFVRQLDSWLHDGRDMTLLVGGPEGLAPAANARAEAAWSLSRLTFPHALARIVVAEQLYRAWSILRHHPYHRP